MRPGSEIDREKVMADVRRDHNGLHVFRVLLCFVGLFVFVAGAVEALEKICSV